MGENWKDIRDFETFYQISSFGNVRSLERTIIDSKSIRRFKSKTLKPTPNTHGYLQVRLSKQGKPKTFRIHQLVAQTYIPNPDNKPEVNHKDGIKINNNVRNLEWATSVENSIHASVNGLLNLTHKKPVIQYDLSRNILNEFESGKYAQDCTGVNRNNIYQCCRKERKTAGGFIWCYS